MEKNEPKRNVKGTQKDCRGIWRSRDVEVCAPINCHMYWKRGIPKFILSMTEWLNPPGLLYKQWLLGGIRRINEYLVKLS